MPDNGDFATGKPDRERQALQPGDWGSVFTALALEAPEANGWQRVQVRLPAAAVSSRTRWPLWVAMAASMALAVTIPLHLQPDAGALATLDSVIPSRASVPAPAADGNGYRNTLAEQTPDPGVPRIDDSYTTSAQEVAARQVPKRIRTAPSQRPIRTTASVDASPIAAAGASNAADLDALYAQSAQLENLLTMARDERVATGTIAALTDDLAAQVASIDAALIQPGLPSQRRSELWGERVDTLRQLVGVEATQRLLAARGQPYDAALVSID